MVRTGASAYVRYGFEDTYGAGASPTDSFGLKTGVSTWTLTTNRTALAALGQVEPTTFAYGQQQGSLSIGFVFGDTTSYKIFQGIYGAPTTSGTDKVFGGLDAGDAIRTMHPNSASDDGLTFTTEIGVDLEGTTTNNIRTLNGCILNTLSLSAAINDTVNCTADITYGQEAAPSTTYAVGNNPAETSAPFTFAHGTLALRTADGTENIAELQEADINFTQNTDLLYKLGQNKATNSYKRVLDITGRFRASWLNTDKLLAVINQQAGSGHKETWGDAYAGGGTDVELNLTFDNAASGKSLVITLNGLSFADHSVTGLEPVEPIFEELNWQAKTCKVTADIA